MLFSRSFKHFMKHSASLSKSICEPEYSKSAHQVRVLRIPPTEDTKPLQHIAMGRFGFYIPTNGFKASFFPYQIGDPMPSQVCVEEIKGLKPIPDLLAFDVCPNYHVFITRADVVVNWKDRGKPGLRTHALKGSGRPRRPTRSRLSR